MSKINILVYNNSSNKNDNITNLLDKDFFNIIVIHEIRMEDVKIFPPFSLIIYIALKDISKQRITENLKILNPDNSIPVLFIINPTTAETYLLHLSSGIYYHIVYPFDIRFLHSKIINIINRYLKTKNGSAELDIEYNRIQNVMNLAYPDLSAFLISALENTVSRSEYIKNPAGFPPPAKTEKNNYKTEYYLFSATERDEFVPYYQPVISLKDNCLYGFEALIRWNHPQKGLVYPDDFIPDLEESPLIIPVSFKLIETAVKQLKNWREKYDISIKMGINLSPKQFIHEPLYDKILDIVDSAGVNHEDIEFEITESAFTEDMEAANLVFLKLRSQKFKIKLDDFGTGYSSMSYLLHFPVDSIKIDKSFVQWMNIDETSEHIVKSIIYLAHNLNMQIVAEGVESLEHIKMLREFNADYGQGYYYSKPVPADLAEEFIAKYCKNTGPGQPPGK